MVDCRFLRDGASSRSAAVGAGYDQPPGVCVGAADRQAAAAMFERGRVGISDHLQAATQKNNQMAEQL
eukprot:641911-Pyramimonas_sp.AAC.1